MFALEEPPNDGGDREGHRFPEFQLMGNKNGGGGLGCKVRGVGAPGRGRSSRGWHLEGFVDKAVWSWA